MVRNAQVEYPTWRESLSPSPKASSHPFQIPLRHSAINEKFASLGREVGRSNGADSHTATCNAYGEVTAEKFPLSTNSSTAAPATGKNRANFIYGRYASHAAQHGRRNRIRPGIFPKSKAHRGQAAGIDQNISFAIQCGLFARRKYIILKLRRGDCQGNSCFFKNKRIQL